MLTDIVFFKGGAGSGNFGHGGRPGQVGGSSRSPHEFPSSASIASITDASDYWRLNFAGHTFGLAVHSAGRVLPIHVYFDPLESHGFTTSLDERGNKIRGRAFSVDRARAMDRIVSTIEHPRRRIHDRDAELLLEREIGGRSFTVVLKWRHGDLYEFASSHFKTAAQVRIAQEAQRSAQKNDGPLQKSGPPGLGPSVLREPYGPGDSVATGSQPRFLILGPYRDCAPILPSWEALVKALPVLADAASIDFWRGDEPELLKAIPDGARWITVHPPGHEKGQSVLIQETQHGSGVYHVVGGAGGKLNYLKLRGVKSKGEYAAEVRNKQSAHRQERKRQTDRDKELGIHVAKEAAREHVRGQVRAQEQEFIRTVAGAMGWSDDEQAPPSEEALTGLSDAGRKQALERHHKALLQRATQSATLNARRLALEAEHQVADARGEAPADDRDLDRPALGYATDYAGRTADQAEDIAEESRAIDATRRSPDQAAAIEKGKAARAAASIEADAIATPMAETQAKLADAEQALKILRAQQALKSARRQAADAHRAIDAGEQKAFVLEVSDDAALDEAAKQAIKDDAKTLRTQAFLSAVSAHAPDERSIAPHVSLGAYNALNGVALAGMGNSALDRDAVDVLGVAGAAQALALRMRADLPAEDLPKTITALEAFHVDHYMQRSEEALREAAEMERRLVELKLPEAHDAEDLAIAHGINEQRQQVIAETRKQLGVALGEMEAHAALIAALKGGADEPAKLALGQLATDDAVRRLRAIGLQRGDYTIEHAGREIVATVTPDGLRRIVAPADLDQARAVRESLDIIEGRKDDPDFWPQGVARRLDLALPPPAAAPAAALARPFEPGSDMESSIRDYIGGRMADGHAIEDIVADLNSDALAQLAGDRRGAYFEALGKVVPIADAKGKPIEAQSRRADFEGLADEFIAREHGGRFAPIHAQRFEINDAAADALHRSFAREPAGPLGFKPTAKLDARDQTALRAYFGAHLSREDASVADLRRSLSAHTADEPAREASDMFGTETNPAWVGWDARRKKMAADLSEQGLDWPKYVRLMGVPEAAYRAVQDHVRGRVVERFHAEHGKLTGQSLKLGRTVVSNHLRHLDAVDPDAREKRMAAQREMVDRLRSRVAGRYSQGSVADRIDAARERQAALEQSQMGMFAAEEESAKPRALGADERHTLGVAAEQQLVQLSERIGQNFKPGQPVTLERPTMTGKFAPQQRAIKLIERNKRLALAQGAGSGKTNMSLGAFAHLASQGKIKRGLFVVPSIVQGQFASAASGLLEPGKFKWHAAPGASREERMKAYADPGMHFSVVTHQALRDDLLHMGAKNAGITPAEMSDRVSAMSRGERKSWAQAAMAAHGMDHDFMMVDEGHNLLNRRGKDDSAMANVVDGISDNMTHYVNASADPIKNDPSEAFDLLSKIAPDRYQDRAAFMRRYGVDTAASRDQLRREMAPYFYPGKISAGVRVHARERAVALNAPQREAIGRVESQIADLRMSKLVGTPNIEAARALSPDSFDGVPEDQHAAIAARLATSAGVLQETALARIIDAHPEGAKLQELSKIAGERRGKPGVIFARSRDAVARIAERLRAEGHRVVSITGADSAEEKDAKRQQFRPSSGEASADILVLSDAGAVGLNAQRGAWLAQNDVPLTAMVHAQRNGRIDRLGQLNPDIELLDLVADHPHEVRARRRLKTKYGLRDIMTSPLEGLDDTGFAAYLRRAHDVSAAATETPS